MACQLAGLAAQALPQWRMGGAVSVDADEMVCNCTHGPNALCPMHKPAPRTPEPGPRCDACHHGQEMAPAASNEAAGTVARRYHPSAPDAPSAFVACVTERPLDLDRSPVSPPPRG